MVCIFNICIIHHFLEEEINTMKQALDKYGIQMPSFGKIGGILANEMSDNDAALHAAIAAINDAIDHQNAEDTLKAMQNPTARLSDVSTSQAQQYQELLFVSKQKKCEQTELKGKAEAELDMYDKLLTQAEIQGHVNKINRKNSYFSSPNSGQTITGEESFLNLSSNNKIQTFSMYYFNWFHIVSKAVDIVNTAVDHKDEKMLIDALVSKEAALGNVNKDNSAWYLQNLVDEKAAKAEVCNLIL